MKTMKDLTDLLEAAYDSPTKAARDLQFAIDAQVPKDVKDLNSDIGAFMLLHKNGVVRSHQRAIDLEVKYERHMNIAITVSALLAFSLICLTSYVLSST